MRRRVSSFRKFRRASTLEGVDLAVAPPDALLACAAGLQDWMSFDALFDVGTHFDRRPNTLHAKALLKALAVCIRHEDNSRAHRLQSAIIGAMTPFDDLTNFVTTARAYGDLLPS